jgi:uncharacterized protein YbjT (DUF2867 family)
MKTLVIGCTGTVGSAVVQALGNKGVSIRCMSHSVNKIKDLASEAEACFADLDQPETLAAAFEDADSMFLVVPVGKNETAQGTAAVEAARKAGLSKIVYMSVEMPEGSSIIPHFKSKIPIENAVKKSGIAYTILRPNNFFQNDRSVISVISSYGIYPTPLGLKGLNRIDVRDIAEAAVNALTQPGHEGQIYPLHGPETLTGRDMARIYSKYVGRDVRYAGNDLDVWVQHVKNVMPEWRYRDYRVMYKFYQEHGMVPREDDMAREEALLGRKPLMFEPFAKELSEEWKSSLAHAA